MSHGLNANCRREEWAPFSESEHILQPWDREWWIARRGTYLPLAAVQAYRLPPRLVPPAQGTWLDGSSSAGLAPHGVQPACGPCGREDVVPCNFAPLPAPLFALPSSPGNLPEPLAHNVGPGVMVETTVVVGHGPHFVDLEWGVHEVGFHSTRVTACVLEQMAVGPLSAEGPVELSRGLPPQVAPGGQGSHTTMRYIQLEVRPERRVIWRSRAADLRTDCVYRFRVVPYTESCGRCLPGPWSAPFAHPNPPGAPSLPYAEATCTSTLAECLPEDVGLVRLSWQVDAFSGTEAALMEVHTCEVQQRRSDQPGHACGSKFLLPPRVACTLDYATGLVQQWECVVEIPLNPQALAPALPNGSFLWRVRARNNAGDGSWSSWSAEISSDEAEAVKRESRLVTKARRQNGSAL